MRETEAFSPRDSILNATRNREKLSLQSRFYTPPPRLRLINRSSWKFDLAVCEFYRENFNRDVLFTQLQTLGVHVQQVNSHTTSISIFDVTSYLLSLSLRQLSLLSEVKCLMQPV